MILMSGLRGAVGLALGMNVMQTHLNELSEGHEATAEDITEVRVSLLAAHSKQRPVRDAQGYDSAVGLIKYVYRKLMAMFLLLPSASRGLHCRCRWKLRRSCCSTWRASWC